MVIRAPRLAALAAAVAACQGSGGAVDPIVGSAEHGSGSAGAFGSAAHGSGSAVGAPSDAGELGAPVGSGSGGSGSGSDDSEPPPSDPGKTIAELGAIPAWQAVVDRTRYLERRKQHGVVYGTLGAEVGAPAAAGSASTPAPIAPAMTGSGAARGSAALGSAATTGTAALGRATTTVTTGGAATATGSGAVATNATGSAATVADAAAGGAADASPAGGFGARPLVWLVDETEGNGALAIRVELPAGRLHPAAGDRVALGGAWALDAQRRYVWHADTVTALPALPPSKAPVAPPAPPGHAIATGDLPGGAHTISLAKDGELAYFQLVGLPPAVDGDGWPVADELGNPVYALLALPGERASYGAQDLRTLDERWALRRGVTYVVRLGHVHKHDGKPATITARTAPVRVM